MSKVAAGLLAALLIGCASTDATPVTDYSGVLDGAADVHCFGVAQNPNACPAPLPGTNGGDPRFPNADANSYLAPRYGRFGADDACKYDVGWMAGDVAAGTPVTFTLQLSQIATHAAVVGAAPAIDAFLDPNHHALSPNQTSTMSNPGTYTVGPITFDTAGLWTMRIHLFAACADNATDSEQAHAAFWLQVH